MATLSEMLSAKANGMIAIASAYKAAAKRSKPSPIKVKKELSTTQQEWLKKKASMPKTVLRYDLRPGWDEDTPINL